MDLEDSTSVSRPKKQRNPTATQSMTVQTSYNKKDNTDYLTESRQKRDLGKSIDPV